MNNNTLFRTLYLIRRFEETVLEEFPRGRFYGTTHTYIGQEADAVGVLSSIQPDDIVVMMHPTFSGYSKLGLRKRHARIRKLWPAENYGQLGKQLSLQSLDGRQIKPLIALLPAELSLGKMIVDYSDAAITLLESQPPFSRYKALIKRANLLLTPDSGPMHIASALGTPIVAFFSMKEPADCGPYMDPALFTILRSDDPVKGISSIDVETVHSAVINQLGKNGDPVQP